LPKRPPSWLPPNHQTIEVGFIQDQHLTGLDAPFAAQMLPFREQDIARIALRFCLALKPRILARWVLAKRISSDSNSSRSSSIIIVPKVMPDSVCTSLSESLVRLNR
jgi:hypothetical protein